MIIAATSEIIEAIMCSHDWLKGRIPGAYFYFYVIFLVLIYRLSNFILFQTVEPRVVEDSIPAYESFVATPNQEDQTDGD